MKITEKVSFNIASEASYVYILSGQKFINSAKNISISNCQNYETFWVISNNVSITYLVNLKGKILETIKARELDLLFPFYPESHLKSL